jgi:asparagine synthase (glutamine-hydrolysing)
MCGIIGFYSSEVAICFEDIFSMNSAISHRGPDDSGIWKDFDEGIVLGHRRLSIVDLSNSGSQPMISHSGRYVIVFNGEIYNHNDLRDDLSTLDESICWKGLSDTETLLVAFEFWGIEKTLEKIAGMFAIAVWDKKSRTLSLIRDRMGEKPLYYGWQGNHGKKTFLFGSELKALKRHSEFEGAINRDAIALFLRHNYIPCPYSIYKGIYKLRSGHILQLSANDFEKGSTPIEKEYWSLAKTATYGVQNRWIGDEKSATGELDMLLRKATSLQMMADVPLGAFLSGGIDSSTIVALMQAQSSSPIKTFSIGFSEAEFNEAIYAKKIALHLGTDHTELYVSPKEAMDVIPKLPQLYDEPFSDSSQIPTFLVSQLAKKHVTVSLSGDAGDELFCGYNRYHLSSLVWNRLQLLPVKFRKVVAKLIQGVSPTTWNSILKNTPMSSKFANLGDKLHKGADVMDARNLDELYMYFISHWNNPSSIVLDVVEPPTILNGLRPDMKGLDDIEKMMVLDGLSYLPDDILVKVDRAAMGVSLESRIPFLDHRVVEFAWKLPKTFKYRDQTTKWILRQVLYKYVPPELVERPKMGFGVPIGDWIKGPLKDWAGDLLSENTLKKEGYFDYKVIRKMWDEHQTSKRNWQYQLWDILMFQSWLYENE